MNLVEFAEWIKQAVTVDLHDGRPQQTPTGNYAYLQTDGGVTTRGDLATIRKLAHTATIVCVGVDSTGARWVADQVRDNLTGKRPGGNHIVTELPAGPELTEGTPTTGGERTSITLTFQLTTRR